ncbi:MAG: type I DNA topoisomerase [Lachnospiraceae bacterium]|nr:type I DNA topoisomerase [Lachnospiraceae bacterium]
MAKNLVIVESPSKIKTIKKFLGSNYEVVASNGHVRDLPKSTLGIEVDNDYEPKYITIRGKGDVLTKLRKEVKKAEKIYLATDPDREGEAISWHLAKLLKLEDKKAYRITFNEITKNAVKASLKEPREIDMNLVDAQQTRRILDRMVGYRISPVLWAKVKRGLSAGRVQSVALRLVCDREEEINAFIPEEYWSLEANLKIEKEKKTVIAKLYGNENGKLEIKSSDEMKKVLADLEGKQFVVDEVKDGERVRKAPLPFITSTLQQEASKQLNFSTQKTMRIAQQLYEGVDIKGEGTVGIITYLRTDSVRIADEAEVAVKEYINEVYGEEYSASENTTQTSPKKTEKKIQDAHEAIRPTDVRLTPQLIKDSLTREQYRLYQLIWKRFVASRMAAAVYTTSNVKFKAGNYIFTASGSKIKFAGFMSVYSEADEENATEDGFAFFDKDKKIELQELNEKQHFTQPPAHFTEATLVRALEERGIGRPSTFAPTITTILARRYVIKENKNLYVTEIGEAVNKIMSQAFPVIIDAEFTANLETLLDKVGEGELNWKTIVRNFYPDLDEAVKIAEKEIEEVEIRDEVSEELCENCQCNMVIKYGPHGKFLACPNFPNCRNTKPYLEKAGVECPKCGSEIVYRRTKSGRTYFGCIAAPECEFVSWQKPSGKKCPECGEALLIKGNKLACIDQQCGYIENIK